jgi:hypothetical protein
MMKPRLIFLTVSLVTAIGLSSCAPAVTTVPTTAAVAPIPATVTPAELPAAPEATTSAPTQPAEVQAVATSRGPNLEATDPATVALASGQLQLVEFFRFT